MPRPATPADLPQLAAVLAAAFDDYAWTRWTVPAPEHRDRIRRLQHLYLEHLALPHGMVWTTDELTAAAAFIPSPPPEPAPGILGQIAAVHGNRFDVLAGAEALIAPHRPAHDWMLATVGVAPHARGRGLGLAVASAGLEAIDRRHGTCLVETSDPDNLPFYRRLGFRPPSRVETAGPPVWIMVRPAAPAP
ncbi:GNAT family N-acetyltransferase [Arthrobacter sp. GCM10027362]|uniref:GNAT family N-acetyltransferase n=1 Tax=Arthrobacter sp. GCM10027362 TaxID=3273379 RepID=UPI00363BAF53